MTPEQKKAKELVETFRQALILNVPLIIDWLKDESEWLETAKQCALICVEEIMKDKHGCGCEQSVVIDGKYQTYITYWQQVKTEIQLL